MNCGSYAYLSTNADPLNAALVSHGDAGMPQPDRPRRVLSLCLVSLLIAFGSSLLTQADGQDLTFPKSRLTIETADNRFEFQVELALTPQQRARGLMFRTDLPESGGMLFDFETPRPVTMWMRNTYIPLDMLFIDDDGRITRIAADARPLSDRTISSGGPVRAVLELRGGLAEELGIRPGDRVLHPLFSGPRSAG